MDIPYFVLNSRFLTSFWLSRKKLLPAKKTVVHGDGCTSRLDIYNHNDSHAKCVVIFPGRNESECYWSQLIQYLKDEPITFIVWNRRGEYDNSICYNYPFIYNQNDIDDIMHHIIGYHQFTNICGLGIYIGGNILLKYIGSKAETSPFDSAIVIQTDFDINNCINGPCSRDIQEYSSEIAKRCINLNRDLIKQKYKNIYEQEKQFLEYENIREYYFNSSCINEINKIKCKTYIIDYRQPIRISLYEVHEVLTNRQDSNFKHIFVNNRSEIYKNLKDIII
jgi:predicted alpha/beta-fold hydrolase